MHLSKYLLNKLLEKLSNDYHKKLVELFVQKKLSILFIKRQGNTRLSFRVAKPWRRVIERKTFGGIDADF